MAGRNLALWAVLALVCVAGLARGQEVLLLPLSLEPRTPPHLSPPPTSLLLPTCQPPTSLLLMMLDSTSGDALTCLVPGAV